MYHIHRERAYMDDNWFSRGFVSVYDDALSIVMGILLGLIVVGLLMF